MARSCCPLQTSGRSARRFRELRLLSAHKPAYNRRSKNPKQAWWLTLTDEGNGVAKIVGAGGSLALATSPSTVVIHDVAAIILLGANGLYLVGTTPSTWWGGGSVTFSF